MTATEPGRLHWQRALTPDEMAAVRQVIEDSDLGSSDPELGSPAQRALLWFFRLAAAELGYDGIPAMGDAQPDGKFHPTDFIIPAVQWQLIGQWIVERCPVDEKISELMCWMDRGPSGR